MTRQLISTGSPFEREAGYSRAVRDGDWVFVSGTTGYDYSTMTMPDSVAEQANNAFDTIAKALVEAGSSLENVVRATYIISERDHSDAVFKVAGERFKDIRPAATLFVASLLRPEMKVEIEVTARSGARTASD